MRPPLPYKKKIRKKKKRKHTNTTENTHPPIHACTYKRKKNGKGEGRNKKT